MAHRYLPPARSGALPGRLTVLVAAATQLRSNKTLIPMALTERSSGQIDPARRRDSSSFAWASSPTGGGGGNGGGGGGGGFLGGGGYQQ